ncbi:MAG: hypothetical protein ABII88_03260 [Candidatus Omnitrophota bacterium]
MDKEKKLKIAIPILILIMIGVYSPVLKNSRVRPDSLVQENPNVAETFAGEEEFTNFSDLAGIQRQHSRSKYQQWKRDPFAEYSDVSQSGIPRLHGIVWDSQKPKAIINETIAGIGDTVAGVMIIDIQKSKVLVNNGEKNIELKVYKPKQDSKVENN